MIRLQESRLTSLFLLEVQESRVPLLHKGVPESQLETAQKNVHHYVLR